MTEQQQSSNYMDAAKIAREARELYERVLRGEERTLLVLLAERERLLDSIEKGSADGATAWALEKLCVVERTVQTICSARARRQRARAVQR